jgi:hypothetical protein
MSLIARPYSWLPFVSGSAGEERRPLLPRVAKREIEGIALKVFVDVFTYRVLHKAPASKERLAIDVANKKIVRILPMDCGDVIDDAVWELMSMVSFRGEDYTPYIRSCKDAAAAYVINNLLLPLKRTATYGDSLLYRAVRESNFKFGPEILAAIASRNDQRFSKSELEDKAVIRLFKERYGAANFEAFVAN